MKWLTSLVCILLLTSCAAQQKEENSTTGAQVGVVNHTGKYIYSSYVDGVPNGDLPIFGGGSGANMDAWGAGIAGTCCASIPRVWYSGMKARVRWDMPEGHTHVVKERIVAVEKYDRPGSIYLHFFPNDEVRVVVTNVDPAHPDHPIALPVEPANRIRSK